MYVPGVFRGQKEGVRSARKELQMVISTMCVLGTEFSASATIESSLQLHVKSFFFCSNCKEQGKELES